MHMPSVIGLNSGAMALFESLNRQLNTAVSFILNPALIRTCEDDLLI